MDKWTVTSFDNTILLPSCDIADKHSLVSRVIVRPKEDPKCTPCIDESGFIAFFF